MPLKRVCKRVHSLHRHLFFFSFLLSLLSTPHQSPHAECAAWFSLCAAARLMAPSADDDEDPFAESRDLLHQVCSSARGDPTRHHRIYNLLIYNRICVPYCIVASRMACLLLVIQPPDPFLARCGLQHVLAALKKYCGTSAPPLLSSLFAAALALPHAPSDKSCSHSRRGSCGPHPRQPPAVGAAGVH